MIKFEAKLKLPDNAIAPEIYDALEGERPSEDFIISRRVDGSVASRYGDPTWDISAWDPDGDTCVLHFDFWSAELLTLARVQLLQDTRWLLFSLIWLKDGAPLAVGTLRNYYSLVRSLALYANSVKCQLPKLLSNEKEIRAFENVSAGETVKKLSALFSHLVRVGETLLGFGIVGDNFQIGMRQRNRDYRDNLLQHPPIPTRIYSTILSCLEQELLEWAQFSSECLVLLRNCGKDPFYGRRRDTQSKALRRLGLTEKLRPEWGDVASPAVRAYLKRKGVVDSVSGLGRLVLEIQEVAKLTIEAYSGMRDEEVSKLPYDCLDTIMSGGKEHCLIQGRTTKMSKGIKRVRWVTNQEGHRAIAISQKIANVIYEGCGTSSEAGKLAKVNKNGRPLFVSVSYLGFAPKSRQPPKNGNYLTGSCRLYQFDELLSRLEIDIQEADIIELEKIDAHRDWRSQKDFQVGQPWRLTTHQFRRSLALYAQRSGLVSMPSLRRQLQHLTEEMSRYYSRGSQYAKDLFNGCFPEQDHFMYDWQAAQSESEALSYTLHVLTANEKLFGGHVAFVKHRLKGVDGIVSAERRAETVRMFKKGQLHYRETLIGGCTSSDECDSPAMNWLSIECIRKNCGNMVGNLAKLEAIVAEQRRLVQSISPTSLLYRTESANLEVLVNALEKVRIDTDGEEK